MAKKSASKSKSSTKAHKSFQLSSHKHTQERAMLYIVLVALGGLLLGWYFSDQIVSAISGV